MNDLIPIAGQVATQLIARRQTIAVSESSTGGLISAALLAVPGASAYFLGGAVVYTTHARQALLGIGDADMTGMRSSSEPYAQFLTKRLREKFPCDWALSETGAAGPKGNRYGDAAGHCCIAVGGPRAAVMTLETGTADRAQNMRVFARTALEFLLKNLAE